MHFKRFYQRFDGSGRSLGVCWPRITSDKSEELFKSRKKGLRVLLINPPIRERSNPNILPLGLGYIAAVTVMDGHHLEIVDLNSDRNQLFSSQELLSKWIEQQLSDSLEMTTPDIIGVGGLITQYKKIKQIVKICKTIHPSVPVVIGGGIVSAIPEFILNRIPADIAVQREGEITFSELLHRIEINENFEGVKGILYKHCERVINNGQRGVIKGGEIGLDVLPWPLRSRFKFASVYKINPVGYLNRKSETKFSTRYSASMIASRGCPYGKHACDYCFSHYLGAKYRIRSYYEVVDEMEYLKTRHGINYIHFLDDLLIGNIKWGINFCKELRKRKKRGFKIFWSGTCRTNIIADNIVNSRKNGSQNFLELAYEVGMKQINFGIESCSQKILDNIDKSGQTLDKVELAVRETEKILGEGAADCSFMIGSPGETEETINETVTFCKKLGIKPEMFFFTTAYPGTKLWDYALNNGMITEAVTGKKGQASDDIIEQYLLSLEEHSNVLRTNFSNLSRTSLIGLMNWIIKELGVQKIVRHPTP